MKKFNILSSSYSIIIIVYGQKLSPTSIKVKLRSGNNHFEPKIPNVSQEIVIIRLAIRLKLHLQKRYERKTVFLNSIYLYNSKQISCFQGHETNFFMRYFANRLFHMVWCNASGKGRWGRYFKYIISGRVISILWNSILEIQTIQVQMTIIYLNE